MVISMGHGRLINRLDSYYHTPVPKATSYTITNDDVREIYLRFEENDDLEINPWMFHVCIVDKYYWTRVCDAWVRKV